MGRVTDPGMKSPSMPPVPRKITKAKAIISFREEVLKKLHPARTIIKKRATRKINLKQRLFLILTNPFNLDLSMTTARGDKICFSSQELH